MRVKFLVDVTWSDDSVKKGTIADLGDAQAIKFISKGYCKKYDKDEPTDKDSGDSKPTDDSTGVDPPTRRKRRVNK